MEKNVIVLGLGRFGYAVATKLFEKGIYVTAVDSNYNKIEKIANSVSSAAQGDITEEVAMKSLGINNYDVAIIATGTDIEASIEATLICKDSGVDKVIAKATSQSHARILKKIGADQIVYPELDTGERLARSLAGSNLLELVQFSNDFSLIEIKAHEDWIGKSLIELDFRKTYKMNVVGFERDGQMLMDIDPSTDIRKGDVLVLIGDNENAKALEEKS
ncbi:Ktr system potassium uptake protein A [Anaerococcus prevotii]|uniref:TrkA-N domain protein n=1 Tax=Anaerococcus prevotii (strain ATCC 9321 / DSM 20548 / JCM 6508 / NCTC 11806 / PC1) TaxID=525919 RepID=C7RFB3_ANAPD|nr:TrkA family potassium uptake protein [Anaerococcus prevotii]ACV28174.1 TrkA-N domain protein [Anaerococcus prevotii DSM 20548]SUU93728.1 Ktr system potassium uptake protein A [Anaerococcus prevotii]